MISALFKKQNGVYVIDNSDVVKINEQHTESIIKATIKNAQTTASNVGLVQNISISGIRNAGDLSIDEMKQDQTAQLSLDNVKVNNIVNDASIDMVNSMMDIFSEVDDNTLTDMLQIAETKNSSLFAIPANPVIEMGTRANTTTIATSSYTKLRNVVTNTIIQNVTIDIIQSCISNVVAQQKLNINSILVDATSSIQIKTISQSQAVDVLQKCTQITNAVVKTTTDIFNSMGIEINKPVEQSQEKLPEQPLDKQPPVPPPEPKEETKNYMYIFIMLGIFLCLSGCITMLFLGGLVFLLK